MRAIRRGLSGTELVVLMSLLGLSTLFVAPAFRRARACGDRSRCQNQLRQLALGAINYADERRFFPCERLDGLAGGPESDHAQRVLETLEREGYIEGRAGWVCPASDDRALPEPQRRYRRVRCLLPSPLVDSLDRPALDDATGISYGWTRRRLNANARCNALLAADRAVRAAAESPVWPEAPAQPGRVGNHVDGLFTVHVDGSVEWIGDRERLGWLAATDRADPRSGFLGIHDPTADSPE